MSHDHSRNHTSEHSGDPSAEMTDPFGMEFWDERYRSSDRIWSREPNPRLVEHVGSLTPGDALDVGSGEGADAIWLASRGWQVTAVDVSTVALDRAARRAAAVGEAVAGRILWQQADVLSWDPAQHQFDLVSAQFMHLPPAERESLHRRLAAAVRPGGTLLVVGHHPSDLETTMHRPNRPDLLFTAEEIVATLEAGEWQVVVAAAFERQAVDPEGRPVSIRDSVLRATRHR